MDTERSQPQATNAYPRRLHELEQRFGGLMGRVSDSPEKDALSVLHGMMHEVLRQAHAAKPPDGHRATSTGDVAQLYRQAPKMEAPAEHTPLPPGTTAPEFALPDASGHLFQLSEHRGRPIVLAFYPLDWSPGCSQQLDLFAQEHDQFERRKAVVVGISVDSLYSHGAWASVRRIPFPLLADFNPKGDVARQYGVFRERDGYSERALYVLDERGIIRYGYVSPYLHHVPDLGDLYAALDSVSGGAPEPMGAHA